MLSLQKNMDGKRITFEQFQALDWTQQYVSLVGMGQGEQEF